MCSWCLSGHDVARFRKFFFITKVWNIKGILAEKQRNQLSTRLHRTVFWPKLRALYISGFTKITRTFHKPQSPKLRLHHTIAPLNCNKLFYFFNFSRMKKIFLTLEKYLYCWKKGWWDRCFCNIALFSPTFTVLLHTGNVFCSSQGSLRRITIAVGSLNIVHRVG